MIKIENKKDFERAAKLYLGVKRSIEGAVDLLKKEYNITREGAYTIICVTVNPSMSQDDIAETLSLSKTKVVRVVDKLEKNGYIERERVENNRRQNKLILKDKAKEVMKRVVVLANEISREVEEENIDYIKEIIETTLNNRSDMLK